MRAHNGVVSSKDFKIVPRNIEILPSGKIQIRHDVVTPKPPYRPLTLGCDFCTQPSQYMTVYPTRGFCLRVNGAPLCCHGGAWSACPQCKSLFEAQQWHILAARAHVFIPEANPHDLAALHSLVWDARRGPADEWHSGQLVRDYTLK